MKVIRYGNKIKNKATTLILGGFSFIHNGHKHLIDYARQFKRPISIMIIENPEFFSHKSTVQPLDDRLQDLANLGVDFAIVVTINKTLAATSGEIFLEKIKESVNAKQTISGRDFALGKNKNLKAVNIENHIIVDAFKVNNVKMSTSLLIEDLKLGNVRSIKKNSPFGYTTTVRVNTKNILQNQKLVNKSCGIYAIYGEVNEILYWGYTHVDINGIEHIFLPQLKVKNQTYYVRVYYQNLIRKIIKSSNDKILPEDIINVKKYLVN